MAKKRINLFNKETYEKVSDDNKILLEDYLLELESDGRASKTIYQYKTDIKGFYCWLYNHRHNEYILDSKKRTFRQFFLHLIKNETSHNRINRFQSSLRNLLEFAVQDDDEYEDYEINVMKSVKGLEKKPVRKIIFLTDEQINVILNYLLDHKKYQQATYLSLSYDSAGRRNEVAQVKKDGFLDSNMTNSVTGKRGKEFKLMYFDRTKRIAKLWLDQRGDDDVDSLFMTREDGVKKAASYGVMYYWVQQFRKILYKETGKLLNFNPHSFRHSALENYNNGSHNYLKETGKEEMPLEVLKVLAHHSDLSTTQSYLQNHDKEKLEKAFFSKDKNIKKDNKKED